CRWEWMRPLAQDGLVPVPNPAGRHPQLESTRPGTGPSLPSALFALEDTLHDFACSRKEFLFRAGPLARVRVDQSGRHSAACAGPRIFLLLCLRRDAWDGLLYARPRFFKAIV